jgi:hypothetical protein
MNDLAPSTGRVDTFLDAVKTPNSLVESGEKKAYKPLKSVVDDPFQNTEGQHKRAQIAKSKAMYSNYKKKR